MADTIAASSSRPVVFGGAASAPSNPAGRCSARAFVLDTLPPFFSPLPTAPAGPTPLPPQAKRRTPRRVAVGGPIRGRQQQASGLGRRGVRAVHPSGRLLCRRLRARHLHSLFSPVADCPSGATPVRTQVKRRSRMPVAGQPSCPAPAAP